MNRIIVVGGFATYILWCVAIIRHCWINSMIISVNMPAFLSLLVVMTITVGVFAAMVWFYD